jgi:hypothetical protein
VTIERTPQLDEEKEEENNNSSEHDQKNRE